MVIHLSIFIIGVCVGAVGYAVYLLVSRPVMPTVDSSMFVDVKDDLPENETTVIVANVDDQKWCSAWFDNDKFFHGGIDITLFVTHWKDEPRLPEKIHHNERENK